MQYAPKDTALQNTIRRQIFAADVGQQFAMSLGIEVAILTAQSQSPLMEDYIKDPIKNIMIGMLGGGTYLGAGLFTAATAYSHIVLRGNIAKDLGMIVGNSLEQTQKIPWLDYSIQHYFILMNINVLAKEQESGGTCTR